MFFWALLLLAIPFGLPLISLISQSLIRGRMTRIEEALEAQNAAIEALERRLRLLSEPKKEAPPVAPPAVEPAATPPQERIVSPPARPVVTRPVPPPVSPPPEPRPPLP